MTRKTGQLCNCGVWLTSLETLRLGHAEHTNPRDNKNIMSFSDQFPSQWLWLNVSNTSVWHVFTNLKFRVTVELNLPFKPVGTLVCCEWQFLDGKTYDWLLIDVECTYVKSFHVDKQIQLIKVRREKKRNQTSRHLDVYTFAMPFRSSYFATTSILSLKLEFIRSR